MVMIKAKLKLPVLKTKTVWYGLYGGHYNCIVFFKTKPIKSDEPYYLPDVIDGKYYDLLDNKDLIIGCMWLNDFNVLFPGAKVGKPKGIEVLQVHQMELTTMLDEDDKMYTLNFRADGYGND
jgi:hypothetical protein